MIYRLDPSLERESADRLADLWADQLDQVIKRMLVLTAESGRRVWPRGSRPEAVGTLARLTAFLADRIISDRTAGRSPSEIDLDEERQTLRTPHFIEKVENTAANMAVAWNKVFDDLSHKRSPLSPAQTTTWPPKLPGRPPRQRSKGTVINHYVPEFTTKPWANETGKVQIVTRDRPGVIDERYGAPRSFGYEKLLYHQGLEDWFALLENAATVPYRKLISVGVLTPEDRYFWISFLIVQFLRTPSYMAMITKGLRERAAREKWPWRMTSDLTRRAYETTFTTDKVFDTYYRQFDAVRWSILKTDAAASFPRTDAPVVISVRDGWHCLYPLTPTHCFLAGSELATENDVPAALIHSIPGEAARLIAATLIRSARRSFVIPPGQDTEYWKALGHDALPLTDPAIDCIAWGGISGPE